MRSMESEMQGLLKGRHFGKGGSMVDDETKKTERTSSGLREAMFKTLDGVISGDITPQQAIAAVKAADQIIKTLAAEVSYREYIDKMPDAKKAEDLGPLKLS